MHILQLSSDGVSHQPCRRQKIVHQRAAGGNIQYRFRNIDTNIVNRADHDYLTPSSCVVALDNAGFDEVRVHVPLLSYGLQTPEESGCIAPCQI